jgi:hypothetical protein
MMYCSLLLRIKGLQAFVSIKSRCILCVYSRSFGASVPDFQDLVFCIVHDNS